MELSAQVHASTAFSPGKDSGYLLSRGWVVILWSGRSRNISYTCTELNHNSSAFLPVA